MTTRYFKLIDERPDGTSGGHKSYWSQLPGGRWARFFAGKVYPITRVDEAMHLAKLDTIFWETDKDGNRVDAPTHLEQAVGRAASYRTLTKKRDLGEVPPPAKVKRVVAKDKVESAENVPLKDMDRVQLNELAEKLNIKEPPTHLGSLRAMIKKALTAEEIAKRKEALEAAEADAKESDD